EAFEVSRRKHGLDHPDTQVHGQALISCYVTTRQHAKAEPLLRELAAYWKQKAGADSLKNAQQLRVLGGMALLRQEKYAEAEPVLRESLAIYEKRVPDEWVTFNTRAMLGGSLLGQGKYAEAEPLLLDGYAGMKPLQPKLPANFGVHL